MHSEIVQKSMMPPVNFLEYSDLPAAVDNIITLPAVCIAAELSATGTDGYIEVHPVNAPIGRFYKMPLTAGQRNSCLFDQIKIGAATGKIDLSGGTVVLFPPSF